MIKTPIVIAAGMFLLSSAAFANEAAFKTGDKDGDGSLTVKEVSEIHPEVDEASFKQIDQDQDGAWSYEEYEVALSGSAGTKQQAE